MKSGVTRKGEHEGSHDDGADLELDCGSVSATLGLLEVKKKRRKPSFITLVGPEEFGAPKSEP